MAGNVLIYVALVAVAVAACWLAARLLGLRRPSSGPSGLAWLDAEDAFDRARKQHQRHHLAATLHGAQHRLDLPTLAQRTRLGFPGPRRSTETLIPLRDIVGTADGAAAKFDRDFLPTDDRSRWRFQQIVMAYANGEPLPPIEVYRLHGRYYVSDGHHRVAASRALGEPLIAAYVTDILR